MENTPNEIPSGLYYIIPAGIMSHPHLCAHSKLCYGLLSGIANEEGKCWPGDEWLSERLDISVRRVQEILLELEQQYLIKRETYHAPSSPMIKKRYIYLMDVFKKCLRNAENRVTDDAENRVKVPRKTAYIESKAKIEKVKQASPPTPQGGGAPPKADAACLPSSKKSFNFETASREEKQEELCRLVGSAKAQTGMRWYDSVKAKDEVRGMGMLVKAAKEEWEPREGTPEKNEEVLAKACHRFYELSPQKNVLHQGYNYLELSAGMLCEEVKFSDTFSAAIAKLEGWARRMGFWTPSFRQDLTA